jgi:hypothetical protein
MWRDNWAPRDFNLKIMLGKSNSRVRKVNQFLIPGANRWNEGFVKEVLDNLTKASCPNVRRMCGLAL